MLYTHLPGNYTCNVTFCANPFSRCCRCLVMFEPNVMTFHQSIQSTLTSLLSASMAKNSNSATKSNNFYISNEWNIFRISIQNFSVPLSPQINHRNSGLQNEYVPVCLLCPNVLLLYCKDSIVNHQSWVLQEFRLCQVWSHQINVCLTCIHVMQLHSIIGICGINIHCFL